MKIAVISDIHGNIEALEAVLASAEKLDVDLIVNLGDILSGPLWPAETAELLMRLDIPTICGNHERQLLTQSIDSMNLSDKHTHSLINEKHRDWLRSLPQTLRIADDILLVHGTPGSDVDYFLETLTPDGLRMASNVEVTERASDADVPLILCGHTHIPRAVRLDDGRLIVNPGSVGLPAFEDDHPRYHKVECGSPHARFAVVSKRDDCWQVDQLEVTYNWEAAAQVAHANGRPDWAKALRTGEM